MSEGLHEAAHVKVSPRRSDHRHLGDVQLLTNSEAYRIAARWKFPTTNTKAGALFYGFHPNDGRPVSEEHRRQCLAYLNLACMPVANEEIDEGLTWHEYCRLRKAGDNSQRLRSSLRNLRQLHQLRAYLTEVPLP